MAEADESPIEIELESLEAIYINELTFKRKADGSVESIELLLHPATGDDTAKQFVCMTLVFIPSSKYPDEIPDIEIKNPRGVAEEEVASLVVDMISKAKESVGEVMLFTLIEMAKDSLTEGNIPHCPCIVCLEHFHDQDSFHRTTCYHYFHNRCLQRYLEHCLKQIEEEEKEDEVERRHMNTAVEDKKKEILCPLCRSPLGEESLTMASSFDDHHQEEEEAKLSFDIPSELKEQQARMAEMFARQKAKGGIIDLEQEKNKYLVNPDERLPIRQPSPVGGNMTCTSTDSGEKVLPKTEGDRDSEANKGDRKSSSTKDYKRDGPNRNHYQHGARNQGRNPKDFNHHQRGYRAERGKGRGHYDKAPDCHGRRDRFNASGELHQDKETNRFNENTQAHARDRLENPSFDGTHQEKDSGGKYGREKYNAREGVCQERTTSSSKESIQSHPRDRHKNSDLDGIHDDFNKESSSTNRFGDGEGQRRSRGGHNQRSRGRGGNFRGRGRPQKTFSSYDGHPRNGPQHQGGCDTEQRREERDITHSNAEDTQDSNGYKENGRGKGRGRYRDMDEAYFRELGRKSEEADKLSQDQGSIPDSRKKPSSARGRRGCRDGYQEHANGRDDEFDGDDRRGNNYSRRQYGARSQHQGGGQGQRFGSRSRGERSSNSYTSQRQQSSDSGADKLMVNGVDATDSNASKDYEINRRWREINFGFKETRGKKFCSGVIDEDEEEENSIYENKTRNKNKNCEANSLRLSAWKDLPKNRYYESSNGSANLNSLYVGYNDVKEEEEDWEDEIFAYAFERRYVRTEHLEEYDKFRKNDYELCNQKMKEKAEKERVLREEDRRIRREQAELERRASAPEDSNTTKSVLEVFQEKQAAKKREAERLKKEQQEMKNSDVGFHEVAHRKDEKSSASAQDDEDSISVTQNKSGASQRGAISESFPEISSNNEAGSIASATDKTKEKDLHTPSSKPIVWVGVKSHPDPGDMTINSDLCAERPGLDEPCVDAWNRRIERSRDRKKGSKKGKQRQESCTTESVNTSFNASEAHDSVKEGKTRYPTTEIKTDHVIEDQINNRSQSSKIKPLTKVQPLNFSKKSKQKILSSAESGVPMPKVPQVTMKELSELRNLYNSESVDDTYLEQCFVSSSLSSNDAIQDATFMVGSNVPPYSKINFPKNDNHVVMSLAAHFSSSRVDNEESSSDIKDTSALPNQSHCENVISLPSRKQGEQKDKTRQAQNSSKSMKKAPPLNLKKKVISGTKVDKCPVPINLVDVDNPNMSKAVKYLGIDLLDEPCVSDI